MSDGTFTYAYNGAGRMVRAESVTSTLVYTYTAQGLRVAQSVDGDVTEFAWDWASGIPEMLAQSPNPQSLYLVGHDTLGNWDGAAWAYHLPDALGSVRQVADGAGAVVDSREWTPYGVEVGGAQGGLGYTGEWQDPYAEFNYLRARWYAPEVGRFTSKDAWPGDPNQPISYNAWLYGYANPIRWVDRTGLSPRVDCANMPPYLNLRELCEIGNGDDDDPTVLDAREKIFRIMVGGGHLYGLANEGFYWGAEMLEHFLDGNGAPKNIQFSMYDQFPHDSGITRATKEERPPDIAVDEPLHITPLLHEFVYNYIQSAADGGPWFTAFAELHGKDYYYAPNGKDPRPYDTGFWAAFGHVVIDGRFSAIVQHSCTYDGYFAEYTANYLIKDRYAWYPEKNMWTPFDFPFAPGVVQIPHHWEESLTVTNPPRAHEYDFSILWTERERIFIKGDFSYFREVESWEWESQYPHP